MKVSYILGDCLANEWEAPIAHLICRSLSILWGCPARWAKPCNYSWPMDYKQKSHISFPSWGHEKLLRDSLTLSSPGSVIPERRMMELFTGTLRNGNSLPSEDGFNIRPQDAIWSQNSSIWLPESPLGRPWVLQWILCDQNKFSGENWGFVPTT